MASDAELVRKACQTISAAGSCKWPKCSCLAMPGSTIPFDIIAALLAVARAEERERAAKVAEEQVFKGRRYEPRFQDGHAIAAAIRGGSHGE